MKYEIEVTYKTGNSFDSWEETAEIGHVWEDPEAAEESFRRLREHWDWYQDQQRINPLKEKKPDFIGKKNQWDDDDDYVRLVDDNGDEFAIRPMYMGYFERPKTMQIVVKDSDVRFS